MAAGEGPETRGRLLRCLAGCGRVGGFGGGWPAWSLGASPCRGLGASGGRAWGAAERAGLECGLGVRSTQLGVNEKQTEPGVGCPLEGRCPWGSKGSSGLGTRRHIDCLNSCLQTGSITSQLSELFALTFAFSVKKQDLILKSRF